MQSYKNNLSEIYELLCRNRKAVVSAPQVIQQGTATTRLKQVWLNINVWPYGNMYQEHRSESEGCGSRFYEAFYKSLLKKYIYNIIFFRLTGIQLLAADMKLEHMMLSLKLMLMLFRWKIY